MNWKWSWMLMIVLGVAFAGTVMLFSNDYEIGSEAAAKPQLDTTAYDLKLLALAHTATTTAFYSYFLTGTTTASTTPKMKPWPVKQAYPEYGALLPFNRIIAYYGNFSSRYMGVLGEYPEDTVLSMLASTTALWDAADPSTPAIPAIEYIAVTAQANAGDDGMYRARMPDAAIDKALEMAEKVHGLMILDVQVGKSTLQKELPLLEKYLKLPNVQLAIDPEFSMKGTARPGTIVGTFTAADIDYAIDFLSNIVTAENLPPKILVVHRFTKPMVTGYKNITPTAQVQVVMNMDGWGAPEKKIGTYQSVVASEPVQFTGFKIFYHNDLRAPSTRLITPKEILDLTPASSFIQYQ
ncbi:MAG: hypothetical protein KGI60_03750 [Patescibacteria group bacterium]|nr:hypothetical protein [Patescibacteria group bacterium]